MTSINYLVVIIKILESPRDELIEDNILVTRFRGQLPSSRTTNIIHVTFWGSLSQDISSRYKVGDYIMVEGYISLRNNELLDYGRVPVKKIDLSTRKIYPLYSSTNDSRNIINSTSDY